MTRVAVFSDSHRDQFSLGRLLDAMGEIDAACFLGDVASDAAYLRLRLAAMAGKPPLYAVRGNNDYASALPDELVCEVGGKEQGQALQKAINSAGYICTVGAE